MGVRCFCPQPLPGGRSTWRQIYLAADLPGGRQAGRQANFWGLQHGEVLRGGFDFWKWEHSKSMLLIFRRTGLGYVFAISSLVHHYLFWGLSHDITGLNANLRTRCIEKLLLRTFSGFSRQLFLLSETNPYQRLCRPTTHRGFGVYAGKDCSHCSGTFTCSR